MYLIFAHIYIYSGDDPSWVLTGAEGENIPFIPNVAKFPQLSKILKNIYEVVLGHKDI